MNAPLRRVISWLSSQKEAVERCSRAVLVSALHVRRQLHLGRDVHVVFPRVGTQGDGLVHIPGGGRGGGGEEENSLMSLTHSTFYCTHPNFGDPGILPECSAKNSGI